MICQNDSSPAIHFYIILKLNRKKIHAYLGGRFVKNGACTVTFFIMYKFSKTLASHLKISLHCEQYSGTFLVAHSPYKDFNMTIQGGQQLPCFMNTGQLQDIIVKFKTPEIKKKGILKAFRENNQVTCRGEKKKLRNTLEMHCHLCSPYNSEDPPPSPPAG